MIDLVGRRTQIRDALKDAGFFAFSTVPDHATPPMVYVAPGDPYVTPEGATFTDVIVRHQLVLVAAPGVNEDRADELDRMVAEVLEALDPVLGPYEVGRPGGITLNGQEYLAVAIDTQTAISR